MIDIDYDSAPNNFGPSWKMYVENKIPPGSFVMALLENDLLDAVSRADDTNIGLIVQHVNWLYNNMPTTMWGSREKVDAHLGVK